MKIFYKLSIAVLMSMACFTVSSQEVALRFGVEAGMNLSRGSVNEDVLDRTSRPGFQVGITADYAFADSWYIQSGLSFTTKGVEAEGTIGANAYHFTVDQSYLQLPVYAAYKIGITPSTRIVINAGPYVAYGVGGRTKPVDGGVNINDRQDDIDTFGDNGILKNFDFGVGAGVGAEFGKMAATFRYEMGLLDIGQYDYNYKNRNLALVLGYKF